MRPLQLEPRHEKVDSFCRPMRPRHELRKRGENAAEAKPESGCQSQTNL